MRAKKKSSPPPPPRLRVISFGAGAIGTYVGGSLALQGHPVVFVERPEVAAELAERGLRLVIAGQENRLERPVVLGSLAEALQQGPFDVGLFALKSYDTHSALQDLAPFASQLPPLLCLQNGVENESTLAQVLGESKVIAGTVTSAIGRKGAGDIVLERLRGMGVAGGNPLSGRLTAALADAGLKATLYFRTDSMKWSKLLTNLLANATSAILDMTPAEIFNHPELYRLEIEQLRETLAVMDALDIPVVDLPGTPVRLLAYAARELPVNITRPLLRRAVGGGRGGKMPSFHIDLASGRGKSEVDDLNGAVARFGARRGVPAPVNALLTEILIGITEGTIPRQAYAHQPEKLIARAKEQKIGIR